jgi:hypothetical protein
MSESIAQLRAELRATMERVERGRIRARDTQEKLDAAQARLDAVGPEPGIGCVVRFVRSLGGLTYDFAALRAERGWYSTGDLGLRLGSLAKNGPFTWEELSSTMTDGTLRVATDWSESAKDVVPALREQVSVRLPGEFFTADGEQGRTFLLGVDETAKLARDAARLTRSTVVSIDPAAPGEMLIGQVGSGKAPVPPPRPDFTVSVRQVVRPATTRPGEESVTVHEVLDNRVPHSDAMPEVVASFEGEDAAWRAAQSAYARNAK